MSLSRVVSRPLSRAEVLDRYVEFVAARCRPNTLIATVSGLRAFFAVSTRSGHSAPVLAAAVLWSSWRPPGWMLRKASRMNCR
jgi:hypothetical protein